MYPVARTKQTASATMAPGSKLGGAALFVCLLVQAARAEIGKGVSIELLIIV